MSDIVSTTTTTGSSGSPRYSAVGGAEGAVVAACATSCLVVALVFSRYLYSRKSGGARPEPIMPGNDLSTTEVVRNRTLIRKFLAGSTYNMLISLAVINTACFCLYGLDAHAMYNALRALAIISTTNAMAGLYLTLFFSDTLTDVIRSQRQILALQETAANEGVDMAVVLGTPYAWTFSSVLSVAMYYAVSAAAWMAGTPESAPEGRNYISVIMTLYSSLVVVHCAFAAQVFVQLQEYDFRAIPANAHG